MIIYQNYEFKDFNTLHVNNIAKYIFEIENSFEIYLLKYLFDYFDIKFYVLGNGSKVLFKSNIIDDPIIIINKKFSNFEISNNKIIVSSGYLLKKLIVDLAKLNIGGFENLFPIPGCIGGCIVNNSGDKYLEFSKFVSSVLCLDEHNNLIKLENKDCYFSYRNSIFKNKKYIILYAILNIKKVKEYIIKNNIKESILYRKEAQGIHKYSCGSLFKNNNYKAYEVINNLKLSNIKINDATLSKKHSNILINLNNASSNDILRLIKIIKDKAKKDLNIDLVEELVIY